jgi:hypothetical protein
MRRAWFLPLLAFGFVGCHGCAPSNPTPVTFEIDNTLNWPIFVADEQQQAGISMQLPVSGTWTKVTEDLTCPCQDCGEICNGTGCDCPPPAGLIRQIHPGGTYNRTWSGQYHVTETLSCNIGQSSTCLEKATNGAPGQQWRAELCFANRLETTPPTTDTFPGTLPQADLQCVDQEFTLPVNGPIVLSPPASPTCTSTSDCTGMAICQDGVCSTSCLPSNVPPLSATWSAFVGDPDDEGFFTMSSGTNRTILTGSGTVASVGYTGGDVQIALYRDDPVQGRLTANMYLTLPGGRAVPMAAGDPVTVTVVESTDPTRPGANGAVFQNNNVTLLVIDAGAGGPILTPDEMQPFTVATDGEEFACDPGDCGRRIDMMMTFTAGGVNLVLAPGTSQFQMVGGTNYEFVPVADFKYDYSGCDPQPVTPFVIIAKLMQ